MWSWRPGPTVGGDFGLFEFTTQPGTPGASPHYHQATPPSHDEIDAFALEHDQVNLRDWPGYPG